MNKEQILIIIVLVLGCVVLPILIDSIIYRREKKRNISHKNDVIKEILNNIQGIRLASEEEKKKIYNIKKHNLKLFIIIGLVPVILLILMLIILAIEEDVPLIYIFWTFIILILFFAPFLGPELIQNVISMIKNKKDLSKKIYIADCYICDKKEEVVFYDSESGGGTKTFYYVKVMNGNYIIDDWFGVSVQQYYSGEKKVKLYISQEANVYGIYPYELKLFDTVNSK